MADLGRSAFDPVFAACTHVVVHSAWTALLGQACSKTPHQWCCGICHSQVTTDGATLGLRHYTEAQALTGAEPAGAPPVRPSVTLCRGQLLVQAC